jgi:4-hydroxy-3-methylbut-2-enyl diphosphate reductase
MDTKGHQLVEWKKISKDDIVIIPAFGTTIETEKKLNEIGIDPYRYNTTCPFVEKVWNRSDELGNKDYTVIIHGKHYHEETRATFSHSVRNTKAVIVRNIDETKLLCEIILEEKGPDEFYKFFSGKYSDGFDVIKDLKKVGVVNQTTMLATETQEIADLLKETMIKKYGIENLKNHFADTRDTLCYATNDNQDATYGLLEVPADFAVVVGGYNSSNTGHIVELCEQKLKTYFISSPEKIISKQVISHYDLHSKKEIESKNYIPQKANVDILLTSGASCPDAVVEAVMRKILSLFNDVKEVDEVVNEILESI